MAASTTLAPQNKMYRAAVAAVDTVFDDQKMGLNCGERSTLHVNVIPSGGANPTVEVLFWSDAAGRFIKAHTALTRAGIGADTPFAFSVDPQGRIVFIAVTVLAGGAVAIETSSYGMDTTL